MNTRDVVIAEVQLVSREQSKQLAPLTDDLLLVNSGLDSLCFAILVVRLEDALGADPFSENEDAVFPVTLGDFIHLYEHAVQ
jgi:acyl carrier protein